MTCCYNCGGDFEAANPQQRYCKKSCRNAMNQRRIRRRKWPPRPCKHCGAAFHPITHSRTGYCCRAHKKAAADRRNRPAHRERDRRRYQTDEEYRERKRAQVRRSHRRTSRAKPGNIHWIRAKLEALR